MKLTLPSSQDIERYNERYNATRPSAEELKRLANARRKETRLRKAADAKRDAEELAALRAAAQE